MEEPGAHGRRGVLAALSRGLVAYGFVGLVAAAIGFGSLLWLGGRVSALAGEARVTVDRLATTMELTVKALHDASGTAVSFGTTIDQSAEAVSLAATTITEVRSGLSAFEAQLRSVSIFGLTPLASPADAVGRVSSSMVGLDAQLSAAAADLVLNRSALAGNAASLAALGDSVEALLPSVTAALDGDALGDLRQVAAAMLIAWAAWSLVPAIGALALGLWLRRQLRVSSPT